MSERFSIKGKGAELFYGDGPAQPSSEGAELRATQQASSPATQRAGLPPSQPATMPPSAQPKAPPPADPSLVRRLRDGLAEQHALHYSYRFTKDEIDALRDVVYELEAKRGLKATRNDLVRLGLDWLIEDYRTRGKESLLMQVLQEDRWRPRR